MTNIVRKKGFTICRDPLQSSQIGKSSPFHPYERGSGNPPLPKSSKSGDTEMQAIGWYRID
jgi:hypothetical protein